MRGVIKAFFFFSLSFFSENLSAALLTHIDDVLVLLNPTCREREREREREKHTETVASMDDFLIWPLLNSAEAVSSSFANSLILLFLAKGSTPNATAAAPAAAPATAPAAAPPPVQR